MSDEPDGGPDGGPHDVEDIFSSFGELFGDFFEITAGGGDVALTISPETAARGGVETIEIATACDACTGTPCPLCDGRGKRRQQQGFFQIVSTCERCTGGLVHPKKCRRCRGAGTFAQLVSVTIPAGAQTGTTVTLDDCPAPGADGKPASVRIVVDAGGAPRADIELPRARVQRPARPIAPIAIALGGVIAVAVALSLIL